MVHPSIVRDLFAQVNNQEYSDFRPGQVTCIKTPKKERLVLIKCAEGWVAFRQFYYSNRKRMNVSDFWSGFLAREKHKTHSFVTSNELLPHELSR